MRKIQLLLLALFLCPAICWGQGKNQDSYYVQKAQEAIQNEQYSDARDALLQEMEANPKNGKAYKMYAYIAYNYYQDYTSAFKAAQIGLSVYPKKDKDSKAYLYYILGSIYEIALDYEDAVYCFTESIKLSPKDSDYYLSRAKVFNKLEKRELALDDCKTAYSLDPNNYNIHMQVGAIYNQLGEFETALSLFDKVEANVSDYSSVYSFRADSYIGLGKYKEATDDVLKALSMDMDAKAFYTLSLLSDNAYDILVTKLKVKQTMEKDQIIWPYLLGAVYQGHNQFSKAIEQYSKGIEIDPDNALLHEGLSGCYSEFGDYVKALEQIKLAIKCNDTDSDLIIAEADILYEMDNLEGALMTLDEYIESNPESFVGYYQRGFYKEMFGHTESAEEDYTTAIVLDSSSPLAFLRRGIIRRSMGRNTLAKEDLETVIALDTIPSNGSVAHYAYQVLGRDDEAREFMKRILEENPDDKGNLYDAACLYSRLGDTEQSIKFLDLALKNGYRSLGHLKRDPDLNNIRQLSEYEALVSQYESILNEETGYVVSTTDPCKFSEEIVEVPFTKEGNLLKVKCDINDLPLNFYFDTGASNVSISATEANFMMKNGYLTSKDIVGKEPRGNADGSVSEGTVINLKKVNFGGLEMTNVRASVSSSQQAPLLLGQTVLGRFGKIEIDNSKKVIRITVQKKK